MSLNPTWLRPNVRFHAEDIYDRGAFERMPILAYALEARGEGCTDRTILDPCRAPGPHVWGCWAVDLLLGKE